MPLIDISPQVEANSSPTGGNFLPNVNGHKSPLSLNKVVQEIDGNDSINQLIDTSQAKESPKKKNQVVADNDANRSDEMPERTNRRRKIIGPGAQESDDSKAGQG